eukprot:CAMPEP_0170538010 /NCGR_PEP_ID=MMETSP0209-20121228/103055_1 /TAXON_ID=665100 ORGANISM="Litonotus pictus, Strain P1" /NCGR_SAMPLE_ID=MMETSP0209 /ASSEMBLY_ACC=CAM_ASM_000301 /LENGTH=304 /DNA_ID=CAMNT_0010839621 /DNA_START=676 /DNA_END=1590 /DNA_ORIENTATION=+
MTYYYSKEANAEAKKAVHIADGQHREISVKWNEQLRNYEMDVEELVSTIKEDKKKGLVPTYIYTSLGNQSTCAVDNIQEICQIANENKIWCHVDASILGNTLLLEERRQYLKGLDKANSIVIEGQRGLPVGLDSAFFWVDETKYVFKSLNEEFVLYVQFYEDNQAEMTNYHFGTARATKSIRLWMVFQCYGIEGLRQLLRKQIQYGKIMEEKLLNTEKFELFCSANFSTVTFRLKNMNNKKQSDFVKQVNIEGDIFIAEGKLKADTNNKEEIAYCRIMINDLYITEERVDEIVRVLENNYNNLI